MKFPKLRLAALCALLLMAALSAYAAAREDRRGTLEAAFLDVGQGDAIFIEAPNGNQVLIDGGPDRSVLRELGAVMPFYDRSIDAVILTHPDQDHIGGLPDVLKRYRVGLILEPGIAASSSAYSELDSLVAKSGIKKISARRGMEIDLGRGAILQILFPDRDPRGMDSNDASVVARLVYGESEFMLTGDSPQKIENYLVSLDKSKTLASDVLKAGHHGSKTSSSAAFVSAVSPTYAVISVGKDNRYGHPNKETLDLFNQMKIKILRTDLDGRIVFRSDGVNLTR